MISPSLGRLAALFVTFAWLSLLLAGIATAGIIVTAEAPGVQASTVAGVATMTFDATPVGSSTAVTSPIGSYSAPAPGLAVVNPDNFGGAAQTRYLAIGQQSGQLQATLNLSSEASYFGFYWLAGDAANTVKFYEKGTLLASFNVGNIIPLLQSTGGPYGTGHYGNPNNNAAGSQPFVYLNFIATNGLLFDRVEFSNANFSSGFETDNHSFRMAPLTAPLPGTSVGTIPTTVTWTGAGDGLLWSNGANWSTGAMPTTGTDVVIPAGATTIQITSAAGTVQPATLTTSRALLLNGGTIKNAVITSAEGVGITATNTSALNGVTLGCDVTVANDALLQIFNNLTLSNGAKVTLATNNNCTVLRFYGTQNLLGTGEIVFGGTGPYGQVFVRGNGTQAGAATLTIDAGITVHGTQSGYISGEYDYDSLINKGQIIADAAGKTLTIENGNRLLNWTNGGAGAITVSGTAGLSLGGTFALSNFTSIVRNGGTVTLAGTLNLAGGTLPFTATTGAWNLNGGTIKGGTITASGGANPVVYGTSALDGVTLACDLTVANDALLQIVNNLTLSNGAKLTLATNNNYTVVRFYGTQSLLGNGEIVFGGTGPFGQVFVRGNGSQGGAATLTIDAGITVHGTQSGYIAGEYDYDSIVNKGQIVADAPGKTISIENGNRLLKWTNSENGKLIVSGTAGLSLGGTFSLSNFTSIIRNGGVVTLVGALNLASQTLAFTAASGAWNINGGTIKGGTITAADGANPVVYGTSALDGVTLNCDLTVANDALLQIFNNLTLGNGAKVTLATNNNYTVVRFYGTQSLLGNGEIVFGGTGPFGQVFVRGNGSQGGAATLTIDAGITVHGTQSGYIAGEYDYDGIVNRGQIVSDAAGKTISLGNGNRLLNWTNIENGRVTVSGTAGLSLGGTFSLSNFNSIIRNGGTVTLVGALNLAGGTLAFTAASGAWNLNGGTIRGGTITASDGANPVIYGTSALDGVSLACDLTVANDALLQIFNNLTLSNGAKVTLATNNNYTVLRFYGTQSLLGNGEIVFGGTGPYGQVFVRGNGSQAGAAMLTIGAGINVHGTQGGYISGEYDYDSIVNKGQIIADAPGKTIGIEGGNRLNTWTNSGAGAITVSGTAGLSLGGTFALSNFGSIIRNGGAITLVGALNLAGQTLAFTAVSGAWNINGGIIKGGTITATGGANPVVYGTSALDGVTLGCDLTVANDALLQIFNNLTLSNGAKVTLATNNNYTVLRFYGTQSLLGTGEIVFGGTGPYGQVFVRGNGSQAGAATLTLDSGITVHGTQSGYISGEYDYDSIINKGQIIADAPGRTIGVEGNNRLNTWSNSGAGALTVSGTAGLSLGGTFSLNNFTSIVRNGGTVTLVGTLNLTGGTLAFTTATGAWNINGGTIKGGTITAIDGANPVVYGTSALDGVTLGCDLTVANDALLQIFNNLTLSNGAKLTLTTNNNYTVLRFYGTQSMLGNGEIVFGGTGPYGQIFVRGNGTQAGAATLTIDAGITVHGTQGGYLSGEYNFDNVVYRGTINADTNGKTITLGGTSPFSQGALAASNGGVLSLASIVLNNTARFTTTLNSTTFLTGNLLGNTTAIANSGPSGTTTFNGSGTAGTPQQLEVMSRDMGAAQAGFSSTNFLYGKLALTHNTYAKLVDLAQNTTAAGTEAAYANTVVVPTGCTLNLNGLHLYAHDVQVTGTVVGGTITQVVDPTVSWTGGGDGVNWSDRLNWSGGQLPGATSDVLIGVVSGNPTIQITAAAGVIKIRSLVTNQPLRVSGGTLQVATTTQLLNNLTLAGGTIVGGTMTTDNGSTLLLTSTGGTLDGVTIDSSLTLDATAAEAVATILNDLTLNGAALLGRADGGTRGRLEFNGTQALKGTGIVRFGNAGNNALLEKSVGAGTLTIGASITIQGGSGIIGAFGTAGGTESIVNHGTINIPAGKFLTLGGASWSSDGAINAAGAFVTLQSNFSIASLGTFHVEGGVVYVKGTLDNTGATLTLDVWRLAGGKIRGGTVLAPSGTVPLGVGMLDGVTLGSDLRVDGGSLEVVNGLTLNQANLILSDMFLTFLDIQTLGGTGEVRCIGNNVRIYSKRASVPAAVLTVGAGVSIRAATYLGGFYSSDGIINLGTVLADVPGRLLGIDGSFFRNRGLLSIGAGAGLSSGLPLLTIEAAGVFQSSPTSTVTFKNSLKGDSTASAMSSADGFILFGGGGTSATPQLLEAMSSDLGSVTSGFVQNFAFGAVTVDTNTYLRLVDESGNASGNGPEAVYADSITVQAGGTLDLNGLNLYAHQLKILGTVKNGSIVQVPNSVFATLPVGRIPSAAVVNSVTNRAYIANAGDDTVSVIDGATGQVSSVRTGVRPVALGINVTTNKVYVANNTAGTVTVIEGATNRTSTVVVGNGPKAVAINPITNLVYVANSTDNTVTVINGVTDLPMATMQVGVSPSALAINLITNKIYVANFGFNAVASSVRVIDGSTNIVTSVSAGAGSSAVAVNAATNKIYVANQLSGTVTIIDGATAAASSVPVGTAPCAIAVNPVNNEIYVANKGDGTVTIINGATKAKATLPVGTAPSAICLNARTGTAYIANSGGNAMTVIDGATGALTVLKVGSQPLAAAVNPITNRIFVANSGSDSVSIIDGSSNRTRTLTVGQTPTAVAVSPITNRIYTANIDAGTVTIIDGKTGASSTVNAGTLPAGIAVNELTNRIYVANAGSANLTVIDGATGLTSLIPVESNPGSVAVNAITNRIYVANTDSNSVTVVDGASNLTTRIPTEAAPCAVAINPVTNRIYVANFNGDSVTVVDGETNLTTRVTVGSKPFAVAVNPVTNIIYVVNTGSANVTAIDGVTNVPVTFGSGINLVSSNSLAVNPLTNKIYVADGAVGNGAVAVIDGATKAISRVTVGSYPCAVAIDLQTNLIYIANGEGHNVSVIDGVSNATTSIAVGAGPCSLAINPVTDQLYIANSFANTVTVVSPSIAGPNNLATSTDQLPGNAASARTANLGLTAHSLYGPNTPPVRQIWYQLDTAAGPWLRAPASGASLGALLPGRHTVYAFATDGQESTSLNTGSGCSPFPGQITAYAFTETGGGNFSFLASTVNAHTGDGAATLTVVRDFRSPARVDYATVNGSALAGTNYTGKHGTLSFAQDEMNKQISVPLSRDAPTNGMAYFTVQLSKPSGSSLIGMPGSEGVFILNDSADDLTLSNFSSSAPGAPPAAGGAISVALTPPAAGGQWRLFGELDWRNSGASATGLTAATYRVEFKPVSNFQAPAPLPITVAAGAVSMGQGSYQPTSATAAGSLGVTLSPPGKGGWRLQGEAAFRVGGTVISSLPAGTHLVEFKPESGLATPENREVIVLAGQVVSISETYFVGDALVGALPSLVSEFPSDDARQYAARSFTGQIQTDNGFGTGFVPLDRVVLTAAHVLFDDGSLSYVKGVRWFFQHETGAFQSPAQFPRGTYLLEGYAAQRAADRLPGVSTPASQQLDVATMYFLQPAARGGQSGYLASDSAANSWLTNTLGTVERRKFIAGYPVSSIDLDDKGRLFATPLISDAFTYSAGTVFKTSALTSYAGNSGGPLFVEAAGAAGAAVFYPAAIYLGGTDQTIVHAIDSQVVDLLNRGQVSGRGGPIDTGRGVIRLEGGLSGTTEVAFGGLTVVLQPPAVVGAGARWGYAPETPDRVSGEQDLSVTPGSYQLKFLEVPGYAAPAGLTVSVIAGQSAAVTASYIPKPPQITNATALSTLSATLGQAFSFQLAASPAARSFIATAPLPPGLRLESATGLVSGLPSAAGRFTLGFRAANDYGNGDPVTATLTVTPAGLLTVTAFPTNGGKVTKAYSQPTVQPLGAPITLVATPATGFIFKKWQRLAPGIPQDVWSFPSYSFAMPPSLDLQATFIPNPYPAVAGTYTGLFTGTTSSPNSRGFASLTVTAQGAFSGTAIVDHRHFTLKGMFDADGRFAGSIAGAAGQPDLIVNLLLDYGASDLKLQGLVRLGNASLTLQARPTARQTAGKFNLALLRSMVSETPQGDGFGTVTVTAEGAARFTGKLGDGTSVTASGSLNARGEWPLYLELDTAGSVLTGVLTFSAPGSGAPRLITGTLDWFKVKSATAMHASIAASGALAPAVPLTALGNVTLQIAGGGPVQNLTAFPVQINAAGTGAASGVNGFTLKITPATGTFTGTFRDSSQKSRTISGLVVSPGGTLHMGYGLFIGSGGETGSVRF